MRPTTHTDESEFILTDAAAEKKFGFSMARTLERANGMLLSGKTIFVTPKTVPKPADMGQIIAANGGTVRVQREEPYHHYRDVACSHNHCLQCSG